MQWSHAMKNRTESADHTQLISPRDYTEIERWKSSSRATQSPHRQRDTTDLLVHPRHYRRRRPPSPQCYRHPLPRLVFPAHASLREAWRKSLHPLREAWSIAVFVWPCRESHKSKTQVKETKMARVQQIDGVLGRGLKTNQHKKLSKHKSTKTRRLEVILQNWIPTLFLFFFTLSPFFFSSRGIILSFESGGTACYRGRCPGDCGDLPSASWAVPQTRYTHH